MLFDTFLADRGRDADMNLQALRDELGDLETDSTLEEEVNLEARAKALDFVAFLDEVVRVNVPNDELLALTRRAETLQARLLPINQRLFLGLKDRIRTSVAGPRELRRELDRFTRYAPGSHGQDHFGFDGLDVLLDGIIDVPGHPNPTRSPLPDMVHFEPTPARVVLDLIDHVGIGPDDVLYDIGSGLGRVVILVSLLAGVRAVGVEYQPEYYSYARRCADELRVTRASFVNADARAVDYADGTIFYMFTPFKGAMLGSVLETLREEARSRRITICSYGSCTRFLFGLPWLRAIDPTANHDYRLAIFQAG